MGVRARFNKSTGDMLAECELATKIDPKQRRANRTGAARDSSQSKKHTSSLGYLTRAPRERQKFVKLSIDSSDEERTREDDEDDESEDGQDSEKEEEEAHWNGKPLLELKLEEDVASRAESKQQEDFYSDPKVARHKSWASCKLLDMSLTGDTALFKCDSFSLFNKHGAASEISDKRRRKTDKMMRAVQNCYVWPDNNKMGRKGSDNDDDEQDEEWRANNRVHNCSATLERKEAIKAAAESQIESAPPSEPSNWRRSIEQAQRHAGQQRHRLGVSSPVLHETVSAEHEGRHYVTSAGCAAARPDLLCKSAASVASLSCAGGQQRRPDLSDGPCELANSGQGQIGGQAAARPADNDQRHSSGRRKRPDAPVAGRDECSLDQLGGADDDETLESNCFLSSRANCRAGEPMDTGGVPLAQARRHRHDGRHSRSHGDDVGHGYDKVHSHASIESAEAAAANLLQLSSAAVHNGRAAESDNDGHHYCPTFGSYASKLDARATQSGAAPAPGPPPDAGVHHLQRQGQQYGLDTGSTGLEGGSTRQAALVGQQQQQQANLAECQAASALSWAGGEKSAANENNGQASTGLQQQSALVKPVAGSTALATAPATANKLHPVSSLTPCGTNSSSARKPIIGGQTELAPPSWSRQQQLAKAATAGGGGAPGQQSAANTHLEQKYAAAADAAVARGGHIASRYCDRSGADADGCSWRKQSAKSGQMASEQSHGGQDEGKQVVMKLTSSKTARQAAVLKISGEADGKQQESGNTTVSSAGKLIGIDLNNVASRLVDTCASSWRLQASLLAGGSHTGSYKVAQIHNKQQQQERHRQQAQRESQQRIAPTETAMALARTTSSSEREARGQRQQNRPSHLLAAGDQSWTGRLRRDEGSSNQEVGRNCDSGVAAPAASRLSRPGRSPASLRRQTNARITRHRLKIQQQRQEQLANLALGERKHTHQQQLTNNNLNNNNCQQVSASSSSSRGIASRSASRSGSFHPVSSHQQQQHLRPGPSEPAHIEIEILQSTPDDQRRQQRQYQESSAARSPSSISSSFSYFKSLLSRGLPSLGQSSSRSARLSLNTASPAGRLALTSLGPDCRRSTRLQTTARPINLSHDQPTPSSSATCSIIEIDSRRQQQQQQRNRTSQRLRKHPNRREIRALTAEHLASANVIVYRSAADMLQSGQASGGTSQRVGGQQQAGSNFRGQYQERQSASVVSKTQHLSGRTNSTSTSSSNNSSANLEPLKRQLHDDDDQSSAASTASSTLSLSNRPFCKICHLTSSKNGDKLISPCKCSGTMRYIHCSCLLKWLEISNRTNEKQPMSCELCSHEYTWHKRFNLHQMKLPKCSIKDIILHTLFVLSLGVMMFCALAPLFYQRNNADSLIGQRQTDNKFAPPPTLKQLGDEPIKARTALTFDRGNNYNDNNIPTDHSLTTSGSNANSRRSQFKVSASLSSSAHHHLNGLATSVSSPRGAAANQLASDEKFILFCAAFFFISFFIAIYAQTKARDTLYGLIVKFANMNLTYYIKEYDHEQQYNGTNGNKTDHYNTPYTSDDQDHRSTLIDAGGQNTTSNSTHQQPSQGTVQGAASHHHKRPQQQAHKMMG